MIKEDYNGFLLLLDAALILEKQDGTVPLQGQDGTVPLQGQDVTVPSQEHEDFSIAHLSVSGIEFNGNKSILQQFPKESDWEGNVRVPLNTDFEANDSPDSDLYIIKSEEFAHTYARSPSNKILPVRALRQKKKQKICPTVNKFDLNRHLNSDSVLVPPVLYTPRDLILGPYFHEPSQIIELHSNGDPADVKIPVFVQPSSSRISSKKAENSMSRKLKFAPTSDARSSVLECVENLVACKSNVSSEQKDALVPDDSIENSENVNKNISEIAVKNIQILSQQRNKRKYGDKPLRSCEICEKKLAGTSLLNHYMGHLKIKPFKCIICDKSFTRKFSLKYHMMIHDNENRFQCPTCKRLFRHPTHYKEHLRMHTGEPFSCKFCSNKFNTRNSFKRHLKLHY